MGAGREEHLVVGHARRLAHRALATLTAILTALQPSLGAATATVPALAAAMPTVLRVLTIFASGGDAAK